MENLLRDELGKGISKQGAINIHEQGGKVQYVYTSQSIPTYTQTVYSSGSPISMLDTVPNYFYYPLVGASIFSYQTKYTGYGLYPNVINARINVYVPENIIINKVTVKSIIGYCTGVKTVDSSHTIVDYGDYNIHGLKFYISDIDSVIPVTNTQNIEGPQMAQYLSDSSGSLLFYPDEYGLDITQDVLGLDTLDLPNGSKGGTYLGDITKYIESDKQYFIDITDTATSLTDASGTTMQAYVILEGYTRNRYYKV